MVHAESNIGKARGRAGYKTTPLLSMGNTMASCTKLPISPQYRLEMQTAETRSETPVFYEMCYKQNTI